MKKLIISILLLTITFTAFANDPAFEKVYDKYKSYDEVINFSIPGFVVRMALWFDDMEPEVEDFIRRIDKVKIMVVENEYLNRNINVCDEYVKASDNSDMVEWLRVSEKGEQVNIRARKDKYENIREMIILVSGEENVMIYMKGHFTSEMFANLAEDGEMRSMFR